MISVHSAVEKQIKNKKPGAIIFPADFRGLGTEAAVKMTLVRLVKEGMLNKLGHGIYLLPKKDPLFGDLLPSPVEVAEAIAKKDKVRIKPAGAYALHKLGLTTQIPMKLVYLTDGPPRQITIGKTVLKFKATTPKKMAMKGKYSGLIIQAVEELGVENIDAETESKITELLRKESPKVLREDLRLAPAKVNDYLIKRM